MILTKHQSIQTAAVGTHRYAAICCRLCFCFASYRDVNLAGVIDQVFGATVEGVSSSSMSIDVTISGSKRVHLQQYQGMTIILNKQMQQRKPNQQGAHGDQWLVLAASHTHRLLICALSCSPTGAAGCKTSPIALVSRALNSIICLGHA